MRVALVHERITEVGGSERVVGELATLWPDARVHVPIADRSVHVPGLDDAGRIDTSWLQRFYRGGPSYSYLLPLLPAAMATTRIDADVVLISHHAFANRVRVNDGALTISYTHTPGRWMWDAGMRRGEMGGRAGAIGLGAFAATQRRADRRAAQRMHTIVVNSTAVAERVEAWWGRDALVVHPPVDTTFHTLDATVEREPFFLLAGRLVPYKRPELAAAAAARAGVRLVVAGDGRARSAVEAAGGSATDVLGAVTDDVLRDLYRRCRALIFPGVEDFGIVPVEAMACGCPVIALDAGGARDTVISGVSGVRVTPGRDDVVIDALADVLRTWDDSAFDPHTVRKHAETFSAEVFRTRISTVVANALASR